MSDEISKIILEELRALRADMQPRMSKVEKWQSNADGKITMFGIFCAGIGSIITFISGGIKH